MIGIRNEVREIENGQADKTDNVLKNAPHTAQEIAADSWAHAYGREKAAFPAPYVLQRKFWPTVGRLNETFGDRNLVCACLPIEAYQNNDAQPATA
jgi:glycine dehydrogenase